MTTQVFHKQDADRLFGRCTCPDDSGSCEWCHVYYHGPEPPTIIIGYDSTDSGFTPTATLHDANGNVIPANIEVRDYGTGSKVDEAGNFYADVTP